MKLRLWVKVAIYIVALYCVTMLEATHPTLALVLGTAMLMPIVVIVALLIM